MNILQESNFFFVLFTLLTLLSITSSPLSLTSYLMAASDNGNGGANDNGNNGRDNNDGDDGGSDDGDGGDDGGSDDGDGGDDGGSENTVLTDTNNGELNKNNELSFVSQTSNLTDQTSNLTDQTSNLTDQDSYEGKAFYILIKSVNNKTDFVPDKVTLAEGAKVTWLNYDTSEHRITVDSGSKSGYPLLNSLILPNGMVDQEFQSVGTYHYSDLDSPQSKGVITILDNAQKEDATSIALEE
jgi:plastocyanin